MQQPLFPWQLLNNPKFEPTVGQLMDLCEENYHLMLKIAPQIRKMQGKSVSCHSAEGTAGVDLFLEVLEQSPYTSLIHLTHFLEKDSGRDPDAVIRIYHDSSQIEVIDLKQKNLPVICDYQPPSLRLKWKANLFIFKWLNFCRKQGYIFSLSKAQTACA